MLDKSFPESIRTERTRLNELARTNFSYYTELMGYRLKVSFKVDVTLLEWDISNDRFDTCSFNFVDPKYSVDDIRQAIANERISLKYIIRSGTSLDWKPTE